MRSDRPDSTRPKPENGNELLNHDDIINKPQRRPNLDLTIARLACSPKRRSRLILVVPFFYFFLPLSPVSGRRLPLAPACIEMTWKRVQIMSSPFSAGRRCFGGIQRLLHVKDCRWGAGQGQSPEVIAKG